MGIKTGPRRIAVDMGLNPKIRYKNRCNGAKHVTVNVLLPRKVWQWLLRRADEVQASRSELVEDCLVKWLNANELDLSRGGVGLGYEEFGKIPIEKRYLKRVNHSIRLILSRVSISIDTYERLRVETDRRGCNNVKVIRTAVNSEYKIYSKLHRIL